MPPNPTHASLSLSLQERTLKCQAIVVRVMKLKKTLAHRDLIVEAIRQCKVRVRAHVHICVWLDCRRVPLIICESDR